MARRSRTPEQVLALLTDSPGRIHALTAAVPASALHLAPSGGEWSEHLGPIERTIAAVHP